MENEARDYNKKRPRIADKNRLVFTYHEISHSEVGQEEMNPRLCLSVAADQVLQHGLETN